MKNILSKFRNIDKSTFIFLLFVLTLIVILFFFPRQAKFKYEFTKGKPWLHESIIAPFDFSILKSENELSNERDIVKSQHLPIYNYLDNLFEINAEDFVNDFEKKWALKNGIKKDVKFTFRNLFKNKRKLANTQKNNLVSFGYDYLKDIYLQGIIQLNNSSDIQELNQILLKSELIAERREIDDFYTVNSAANKINLIDKLSDDEYEFLVPLLLSAIEQNILYDKLASEELLTSELSNINPTKGLILSGQVIINKGELVDEKYQVLFSLKQKYEGSMQEQSAVLLVLFGQLLLVGIALLILWLFLRQYRNKILEDNKD